MTLPDLDEKIARNEARLKQLRQEANQLAEDIAAAKAFRDAYPRLMAVPNDLPLDSPAHIDQTPLLPRQDVSAPDLIREAIMMCGEEYSIYDIEQVLSDSGSKVDRLKISQTLSDWARKGKVHVRMRGLGKTASIYTKDASKAIDASTR